VGSIKRSLGVSLFLASDKGILQHLLTEGCWLNFSQFQASFPMGACIRSLYRWAKLMIIWYIEVKCVRSSFVICHIIMTTKPLYTAFPKHIRRLELSAINCRVHSLNGWLQSDLQALWQSFFGAKWALSVLRAQNIQNGTLIPSASIGALLFSVAWSAEK